jgi:hypothetical protein
MSTFFHPGARENRMNLKSFQPNRLRQLDPPGFGHGSKPGYRGTCGTEFFESVHHIVSSAVEPARLISPGWQLAGTRIDTRYQIAQAGPTRAGACDTASTSCCARKR